LVPPARHVPKLEMPILRLDQFEAQSDDVRPLPNKKDAGIRLGVTTQLTIRGATMSRREPINQIKWEDVNTKDMFVQELSQVNAGPEGICKFEVFKLKSDVQYLMHCSLIHKAPRKLSATTMQDAKSEAVDIVRILLHNILSDL